MPSRREWPLNQHSNQTQSTFKQPNLLKPMAMKQSPTHSTGHQPQHLGLGAEGRRQTQPPRQRHQARKRQAQPNAEAAHTTRHLQPTRASRATHKHA